MKKNRLFGIDICRGLAAYAVVLLHSGDKTWAPLGFWASQINSWFNFAVPFFLAASFYFMVPKLPMGFSGKFWKQRFERLFIPYVIWTVVYVGLKAVMFLVSKQPEKLQELFQDPISIILFGGASIQLYYLPMLFAGTLGLIIICDPLVKRNIGISTLAILTILSIGLYELLVSTGNTFHLGPNIAFESLLTFIYPQGNNNPLLRILLVSIAWIIRCLPYMLLAMLLTQITSQKQLLVKSNMFGIVSLVLFGLVSALGTSFMPNAMHEFLSGYLILIFGIYISNYLTANQLIDNLGLCSFGIYLMHPVFMQILELVVRKVVPSLLNEVSLVSKLVFSLPCFLITWLAVAILMKNKLVAKYMFGN
jgi:peptidoglycan/LPS O-acetylase OafA/YrhL